MKNIITIIFAIFISIATSYAQTDNNRRWFVAEATAQRTCDANGKWSEWSEWKDCNYKVLMDAYNNKLVIFTDPETAFDIVDVADTEYDAEGTSVGYRVVDGDSNVCRIRIRVSDDSNVQIYIDKENISTAYDLYDPYYEMYKTSNDDEVGEVDEEDSKSKKSKKVKKDDEDQAQQTNVRKSKVTEIDVFNLYKPRKLNYEFNFDCPL